MSHMLAEHFDCPVHGFTRPLAALEALPELNVAVVVTDYHMPQIDGVEFMRRAAQLSPEAVFVIISGHNLTAEAPHLERMHGLKGIIPKPFGARRLAGEIARVWPSGSSAPVRRADATSV